MPARGVNAQCPKQESPAVTREHATDSL